MLDLSSMYLKDTAIQVDNEGQNMQSILQYLMKMAINKCEFYSTDFLIFYDYSLKKLYNGDITEVDIYFYQMGVHWQDNTGYKCGAEPKNYRYAVKLIRENERNFNKLFDIKCYYMVGNA